MTALRVRYREGQPLRADDLTDEQAYRLGARRRHALAMHGWGIVRGLRLETTPEGLLLHPGLAIDGYGRELIVPAAVPLSWDDLFRHFASPPAAVDLWLAYARTPLAPPHGDSCGEGRHDRWREQARLRLYPTDLNSRVDSRKPPGVTPGPLDPRLAAAPPDEASAWPVYLGRVLRVQPGPDSTLSGRVLHTTRPYATLVGEAVGAPLRELTPPPEAEAAPSTQPAAPATGAAQSAASTATEQVPPPAPRARVQVGAERLGDSRRFAVELPDHQGAWAERLALSRSGDLTLHGQTTIRRERAQLDTFTGELFRLRSQWPFKAGDLNDLERLAGRLAHPETPLWHYLRRQLSTSARDKLDAYVGGDPEPAQLCPALVRNLNRALILAPLVDYLFIAGRTWPFSAGDLKDPSGLADGLIRGKTQPIGDEPFYRWLYQKLAPPAKKELAAYEEGNPITKSLLNAIVAALNKLIGQFDAGLPGDLHIRGASFRPLSAPPPAAAPWRLYRTGRTVDGVTSYELCAEIGGAGKQGDSARYRLAVGVFDRAAVRFRSCLSVTCGRVTVAGKLVVQGQLRESPIDLNPNDPRFGETLFQQLASGLALGFDTTSLQLTIAPVDAASYTITIENRSDQKITNINLYEILYVGNTPVRLNEQHRLQDLAAKGKAPLTLTIPDTGHARAVITVYGFRADFRLVYQAGEAVVR